MYQVKLARKAVKSLKKISKPHLSKVLEAIEKLELDPKPKGCKKLVGQVDLWRIRVGDYRIIYSIESEVKVILITQIGSRGDVYKSI